MLPQQPIGRFGAWAGVTTELDLRESTESVLREARGLRVKADVLSVHPRSKYILLAITLHWGRAALRNFPEPRRLIEFQLVEFRWAFNIQRLSHVQISKAGR